MNVKIAKELLAAAREIVSDDADDFVRMYARGNYKHMAFYKNRKKPTTRPTQVGKAPPSFPKEQVEKVATKVLKIEKKEDYLVFTFEGTAGRTDTYVFMERPLEETFPSAKPAKKKVSQVREEIRAKLEEAGLKNLGTRHGKAGEMFAVDNESARRIGLGSRDLLMNYFQVYITDDYEVKRPDQGWRLQQDILLSKVDDRVIKAAVQWVRKGPTMRKVRDDAREQYRVEGRAYQKA